MAVPVAALAKLAAAALSDEDTRKRLGWIVAAICSPLILTLALICSLLSGSAEHNNSAVLLCFHGGTIPDKTPAEYVAYIEDMRRSFTLLDDAVAAVNGMTENGDSLDGIRVKAVFYALYFGEDTPSRRAHRQFADCFVTYEERTRTVTDEDGTETEESYTVAIPVMDMVEVYSNIENTLHLEISAEQKSNADSVYNLVRYGVAGGSEGWIPGAVVPFIGADGFCSPIGSGWERRVTSEFGNRIDPIIRQKRRLRWTMEVTKVPKKIVTVIEPKRSMTVDKEKYRQKKVAAYCRVSTDSEEQLVSYANQKKVYTEMIASRKDWCFAGLFADEGKSGTRADKRPEFNKMINDCLAGKIDYIITKSVSRFARNTVDCLDYVRMLKSKGIGVYFEEQQIDTLKTDSELYLVIYAGFAQSESESISKNITWSVRKKFEEGTPVFIYKRFLGYKKGADGEPEIVPSEAAIVERIFNLYLAGETVDNISKMMQAENYDIPGKTISFSKGMIMNMLSNERYCGDVILQKSVTVDCIEKKRKKNTGEAPMYYVQNNHPAIIDRVTFNKVQEELARRKTKTPGSAKSSITSTGKYSRYALTDVLICGNCGTRYRRVTWSRNGTKRIVWRCISRLDYGKKYCSDSPTIMEDKLQEAIVRAVNKFNKQDNATYKALMKATISEALGLNGDPEEVDMLERKIEALNNKMLALVNESVSSGDGIEAHESEFMTLSQEAELLKQRITAIQESTAKDNGEQSRLEQIQAIISERESKCMEYDDSIVRQMVECIKVYPGGKLEIIFGGGYLVEESV